MNSSIKILICLLVFSCISYSMNSELKYVMTIIANGAKAPSDEFLDSLNEDRFGEQWENPDELTATGIRQMYLLGTRNKIRYNSFLSENYLTNEIEVKAQISNSTLASAEAYMQGLYPHTTGPNLSGYQRNVAYPPQGKNGYGTFNQEAFGSPALPYNAQVFSVESMSDRVYDYFFLYNIPDNCQPLYYETIDNQKNNNTKAWLSNFRATYGARLKNVIGFSDDLILEDYHYTLTLLKDFVSDLTDNKLLKKLTDNGISITEFNATAHEFLYYDLYSVKNYGEEGLLANITFGTFGEEIEKTIDRRIALDRDSRKYQRYPDFFDNEEDQEALNPKMQIYIVDPLFMASLMKYMEKEMATKIYSIPYASSLYFELKQLDGKDANLLTDFDYFVDIIFNDIPLKTVSYANFKTIINDSWSKRDVRWECSLSPWEYWGFKNASIILAVLLGVVLILILIVGIILCCREPITEEHENLKNYANNNNQKESEKNQIKVEDNNQQNKPEEVNQENQQPENNN